MGCDLPAVLVDQEIIVTVCGNNFRRQERELDSQCVNGTPAHTKKESVKTVWKGLTLVFPRVKRKKGRNAFSLAKFFQYF